MITDNQIRNQILRRIHLIPSKKLKELDDYLAKLINVKDKKPKILSFAGLWDNIDNETFSDLTSDLYEVRRKNNRRIDG